MSVIETVAVATGVLYVILAVRSSIWCWGFGIVSALAYIIFDLQLKYFQDAILQSYYVFAGVYGWVLWSKKDGGSGTLQINSWSFSKQIPFLIFGFLLFPIMGFLFSKVGNSYSYLDAFTTVFSFIATYFTTKKIVENWLWWIVLDMIFIVQYFLKEAYLTSGLFLFFTLVAIWGYYEWKKQIRVA